MIGVAADGFHGLDIGQPTQVFVPFAMQPQLTERWVKQDDRRFRWVKVYARLSPGVTSGQAAAGLTPFFRSLLEKEVAEPSFAKASADTRRTYLRMRLEVLPAAGGHSMFRSSLTRPLWILTGVAGGVLLIACANVASLLIARGTARQREIALRLALGASRLRIVRQLVVEGFVLAAIGGLAGLLVASWGAELLIAAYTTPDNVLTIDASPDLRIVAYTLGVVGITTLLCALLPALQSTRPVLTAWLKEGARSLAGSHRARVRKGLVVVQVALSLLLLIGAGLFVRSLRALVAVHPGFDVGNVVSFSLDPQRNGYSAARSKQLSTELLDRVRATPGVESAAYAFFGLLGGGAWGMPVTIEGRQQRPGEEVGALMNSVSPGFFRTLRIALVSGRDFTDRDARVAPVEGWPFRVAVANETFVTRYLDGRSPLGVHVGLGNDPGTPTPIEIVGVVADAKYTGVRNETPPQLWLPYLEANDVDIVTFYVRTTRPPDEVIATMRRTVQRIDPTLPIYAVNTLQGTLEQSVATERIVATLSAVFGSLATLLAAVGLYGVMAYRVTQRTPEIGVRMALGAERADVMRRVLREAAALVAAGMAAGLVAAWSLSRYVESQLFGLRPNDPSTIALSVAALAAVALLAALVPARRAARIDPIVALRTE